MTTSATKSFFQSAAVALALLTFLSCSTPRNTAKATRSPGPRVFLLAAANLKTTRERSRAGDAGLAPALAQLERDAQEALTAGPFSVVDKNVTPPSGDKHDYMSQAPYFWPNPETTNGLPYIRRDGEHNPEIRKISDHRSIDDMGVNVETLALAWYFKGDEAYATKAAGLLRAWFFDPKTRMNPNLQFAQGIPGVTTGRGIGLIETRVLARVVDSVGLLAGSTAWTAADQRQIQEWFTRFLDWMRQSKNGREEAAGKNNHGTYYDMQAVSFALFLGKQDLAKKIIKEVGRKRIAVQIEPDGRQPLELARTRAWGYSIGNLTGLMLLARLGENVGVDLWNFQTPDGRGIRGALDFLAPFGLDEKKWPYQQLGGWTPQALHPLLRQAALKYPDAKYQEWAAKISPLDPANRGNLLRPKIIAPTGSRE